MAKTERIYVRITPELKEQLQAAADAENRTITNYVENLIKQALKAEYFFKTAIYKCTGEKVNKDGNYS